MNTPMCLKCFQLFAQQVHEPPFMPHMWTEPARQGAHVCSLRFADRGTEGAWGQSPAQGLTAMVAEPGLDPKPLTEHEGN